MLRRARIYFVLAAVVAVHATSADAGWSAAKQAEARHIISRFLRVGSGQFPSTAPALSVAIGLDNQLVMSEGFGDAAPGEPATADTVYRIGSLTKQFTAAATLKLIEDGARSAATGTALKLDMPVTEMLGEAARWTQPDQRPITVRSLLTMTSNLPNFTRRPPPHLDPWGGIPATKLLDEVRQLAPSGWPSSFEYSNTNYFLLSAIIDAAVPENRDAPRGYANVLKGLVFQPAGMATTGFSGEYFTGKPLARPMYRRRPAFNSPDWLRGSGDMASTARDLFAWNSSLLSGRILAPQSVAEMFAESARVTPTDYYGMGWFISQKDGWALYSHTGAVPGFTSFNAVARDTGETHWESVTLLTNMDGVKDLDGLADELMRLARREP